MTIGFIKIHRKIIDWEWYSDTNTFRVFLHLLLTANFENKKWQGIEIARGQLITSLEKLAKSTSLSIQQVRTALDKLKSTREITIKSTSTYTLITLTNYSVYQDKVNLTNTVNNTQDNNQATNEQQTDNKRATTTKEIKEYKEIEEDKKIIIPNFIDQILFDEFLNQRKKDKNKLEGLALKLTIEDLEKWEKEKIGSANDALRNAIKGNWKSLVQPRQNNYSNTQSETKRFMTSQEIKEQNQKNILMEFVRDNGGFDNE
jgi:hypothetical protein